MTRIMLSFQWTLTETLNLYFLSYCKPFVKKKISPSPQYDKQNLKTRWKPGRIWKFPNNYFFRLTIFFSLSNFFTLLPRVSVQGVKSLLGWLHVYSSRLGVSSRFVLFCSFWSLFTIKMIKSISLFFLKNNNIFFYIS